MNDDLVLNSEQAGKALGISGNVICNAIRNGTLKAEIRHVRTLRKDKTFNRYRIKRGDLKAWHGRYIEAKRIESKMCGGSNTVLLGYINDKTYNVLLEMANKDNLTINQEVRKIVYEKIGGQL